MELKIFAGIFLVTVVVTSIAIVSGYVNGHLTGQVGKAFLTVVLSSVSLTVGIVLVDTGFRLLFGMPIQLLGD